MDAELKGFLDEMERDLDMFNDPLKASDVVTSIANAMAGGYQRIRAKHSGVNSEPFRELDEFIYELESSLRSLLVD
jgi:hypothetical protein